MRIFAFHLLNDFSGSPKVLSQLTDCWKRAGLEVHLVTAKGGSGFLSFAQPAGRHFFTYRFFTNKLLRLTALLLSQIQLFFSLFFKVKKGDTVYINTVLPFGAGLLGWVKGCRVIYHIHETSVKPAALKKFLFGIAKFTATDAVFVSRYLAKTEWFPHSNNHIVYNCMDEQFEKIAALSLQSRPVRSKVLMVCSLKDYKGVPEFVQLAEKMPGQHFRIVLNASMPEVENYFGQQPKPGNLEVFPVQTDLHPHYSWADLILNLSRPNGWVETFGLTILEGMAYGLPAIVPPIGGITELVEEGSNGYKIDGAKTTEIAGLILNLFSSQTLYRQMQMAAKERATLFSSKIFRQKNLAIMTAKHPAGHTSQKPSKENYEAA